MRARDNPFSTDRVLAIRYRGCDWDALLSRLAALSYRAAIIGPEGSGKTTLLEDLGVRLAASGVSDVALVDGADLLGAREWRRLQAQRRRLIVTSHRAGLLPTLIACSTTPELLADIARDLAGNSLEPRRVQELFRRHGGNVREALRELYESYAVM